MRLANSVAIITGGSTGIGREIAAKLSNHGAAVVVADITEKTRLKREVGTTAETIREDGGKARYQEADVSDEADVRDLLETTVDEFGRLDILVNNAGTAARTSATETSLEDWQTVLDVNLTFLCSKYALPHLEESPRGRIVNISSERGLSGGPNRPAYSSSKGGVSNLTRQLAID
ncbi:hypothetical protein JCM18750_35520 [Halostagnicola bangensis]